MIKLRRFITPLLVSGLLAIMAMQLLISAQTDSATADEPIHLLSGYATLTEHHILFDPEHPFLVKAIAAIPLIWLQPEIPEAALHLDSQKLDIDYNSYFEANQWGWELLFNGSDDPYQVLFAARAAMIVLTLGLALVVFWWSRLLFGTTPAIFVLALLSFDPNIIAHGKFINTDIGASLFFIGTLASYWCLLQRRRITWIFITGVMLGLGMLTKFSLGMLSIILPLLTVIWLLLNHRNLPEIEFNFLPKNFDKILAHHAIKVWVNYFGTLISIGFIALAIIWLGYGTLMVINPEQNPTERPNILEPANTFLSILPPSYAKGVANIVAPNRQGYIIGQCFEGSRWDYFPILSLFKTPLPTIAAIVASVALYLFGRKNNARKSMSMNGYFFIVPAIVYLSISGLTGINIGIRHIFPVYILMIILTGYGFIRLLRYGATSPHKNIFFAIAIFMAGSVAISSFMAWPYYLPYYNAIAGEPRNVPFIADDSNTDWGQGTRQLAEYVESQQIESIAFDNFISRAEADYLEIPYTEADANNHDYKGYIAISRSTITNHICQRENDWGWLVDNQKPVAILGGAVNIYYLE